MIDKSYIYDNKVDDNEILVLNEPEIIYWMTYLYEDIQDRFRIWTTIDYFEDLDVMEE